MSERTELTRKMELVALALPAWKWEPSAALPEKQGYLRHTTGALVFVRQEQDRLHARPCWPTDDKRRTYAAPAAQVLDRMTVGASRPAEAIARDIERRMLTGLPAAWNQQVARMEDALQWEARATRLTHEWAQRLAGHARIPAGQDDRLEVHGHDCSLSLQLRPDGSANITRHGWLPASIAQKLLGLLEEEFAE